MRVFLASAMGVCICMGLRALLHLGSVHLCHLLLALLLCGFSLRLHLLALGILLCLLLGLLALLLLMLLSLALLGRLLLRGFSLCLLLALLNLLLHLRLLCLALLLLSHLLLALLLCCVSLSLLLTLLHLCLLGIVLLLGQLLLALLLRSFSLGLLLALHLCLLLAMLLLQGLLLCLLCLLHLLLPLGVSLMLRQHGTHLGRCGGGRRAHTRIGIGAVVLGRVTSVGARHSGSGNACSCNTCCHGGRWQSVMGLGAHDLRRHAASRCTRIAWAVVMDVGDPYVVCALNVLHHGA